MNRSQIRNEKETYKERYVYGVREVFSIENAVHTSHGSELNTQSARVALEHVHHISAVAQPDRVGTLSIDLRILLVDVFEALDDIAERYASPVTVNTLGVC